jgi:hypothetical protein
MKAEITLTDANGEIHLSGVTIKARLIEFIERHWVDDVAMVEGDPFSPEARLRRAEERLKRIEMFIGIGEGYYSESSLDSRIDRLEDWRRDSVS